MYYCGYMAVNLGYVFCWGKEAEWCMHVDGDEIWSSMRVLLRMCFW